MTAHMHRKEDRYPLRHQPEGRLFLKNGAFRHLVNSIRDISSTGISISTDKAFSEMTDVKVEYATQKGKIEVFGRVVWCADEEAPAVGTKSYHLGVELLSPMTLVSVLQRHTALAA